MPDYKERELDDDYPIFCGYWYVADGNPVQSEIQGTAEELRGVLKCERLESFDTVGRGLPLL